MEEVQVGKTVAKMIRRELRKAALALLWTAETAMREGGAAAGHLAAAATYAAAMAPHWRREVSEPEWYALIEREVEKDVLHGHRVERWSDGAARLVKGWGRSRAQRESDDCIICLVDHALFGRGCDRHPLSSPAAS